MRKLNFFVAGGLLTSLLLGTSNFAVCMNSSGSENKTGNSSAYKFVNKNAEKADTGEKNERKANTINKAKAIIIGAGVGVVVAVSTNLFFAHIYGKRFGAIVEEVNDDDTSYCGSIFGVNGKYFFEPKDARGRSLNYRFNKKEDLDACANHILESSPYIVSYRYFGSENEYNAFKENRFVASHFSWEDWKSEYSKYRNRQQ